MNYREIALGLYEALEEALDMLMESGRYEEAKGITLALGYYAVKLRENGESISETFLEALMKDGEQ